MGTYNDSYDTTILIDSEVKECRLEKAGGKYRVVTNITSTEWVNSIKEGIELYTREWDNPLTKLKDE